VGQILLTPRRFSLNPALRGADWSSRNRNRFQRFHVSVHLLRRRGSLFCRDRLDIVRPVRKRQGSFACLTAARISARTSRRTKWLDRGMPDNRILLSAPSGANFAESGRVGRREEQNDTVRGAASEQCSRKAARWRSNPMTRNCSCHNAIRAAVGTTFESRNGTVDQPRNRGSNFGKK